MPFRHLYDFSDGNQIDFILDKRTRANFKRINLTNNQDWHRYCFPGEIKIPYLQIHII